MVQLTESALRMGSHELAISSLRPTIYRPSRPTSRVTTPEPRDGDAARRPAAPRRATPPRSTGPVKPS